MDKYIRNVQLNSKDKISWNYIFLAHEKYISNVIKKYIYDGQYQNDVFQEVCIKIIRNINSYDVNKSFNNWLYTLTKNVCFTWLKTNVQTNILANSSNSIRLDQLNIFPENKQNNSTEQVSYIKYNPDDEFENKLATKHSLIKALELVKNKNAALAFKLKILNNLTLDEISQILQTPTKTIKNWIYRDVPKIIRPHLEVFLSADKKT